MNLLDKVLTSESFLREFNKLSDDQKKNVEKDVVNMIKNLQESLDIFNEAVKIENHGEKLADTLDYILSTKGAHLWQEKS